MNPLARRVRSGTYLAAPARGFVGRCRYRVFSTLLRRVAKNLDSNGCRAATPSHPCQHTEPGFTTRNCLVAQLDLNPYFSAALAALHRRRRLTPRPALEQGLKCIDFIPVDENFDYDAWSD